MSVIYLNLTNGLEYIEEMDQAGLDYKFIRIQSTLCEAHCWDRLIQDLDYNFLFDLAQGEIVQVFDTSSNKKTSRALYQGLEFIKYVLNRRWFNLKPDAYVKGHKVTDYFETEYMKLSYYTKKKLDYVGKFLNTDRIYLQGFCKKSLHDGQYKYFKSLLN